MKVENKLEKKDLLLCFIPYSSLKSPVVRSGMKRLQTSLGKFMQGPGCDSSQL